MKMETEVSETESRHTEERKELDPSNLSASPPGVPNALEGAMTPITTHKEEVHSVTFMSYNSTGISSVKCNFICDICDEYNVDYLAIQEHFNNTKTTDTYFHDKFRDYNSYVIPGYRPPGQDSGRSKAGIAQLSRRHTQ